ncbi:Na/Pi cotransporter family protein [Pelagibius sp. 7325]|uniref:Na/Pi cotransporter family protein n=2 Tax=Pseudomonadati TaxID=3379134 RepID=UPI0030EF0102
METIVSIVGGVALLLWGVRMVRTGVTRSFGAELRRLLAISAKSRFTAFLSGLAVTSALQSGTATTLIITSFAAQGLIGGGAALAIILGADVGTTVVVQVLSFGLDWLSPLLIAAGVFGFLAAKRSRHKNLARITLGLGLLLLALHLIVNASAPLRESQVFGVLVEPLSHEALLAVLVAAGFTWVSHSSVAMVLLIMSLAASGVFPPALALTLVLGANLGAAITPLAATWALPAAARRPPLGNLIIRTAGVLAVLPMLHWIMPYLTLLGAEPARLVANFHTLFNLAIAVLFLPFVNQLTALISRLLPDQVVADDPSQPKYLDPGTLDTPAVALTCATREALRMGDEVKKMLLASGAVLRSNDETLKKETEAADDIVDRLHEAIKLYLTKLNNEELDTQESARSVEILNFTTNLEHIGDIIDKNLMELASKKIKNHTAFSSDGMAELESFHARIVANLDLAMNVFASGDIELARQLLRQKTQVRELERRYIENHYERISARRPESITSSSLHLDVLRDLKRINSHLTSAAYSILERAGELSESRLVEHIKITKGQSVASPDLS